MSEETSLRLIILGLMGVMVVLNLIIIIILAKEEREHEKAVADSNIERGDSDRV